MSPTLGNHELQLQQIRGKKYVFLSLVSHEVGLEWLLIIANGCLKQIIDNINHLRKWFAPKLNAEILLAISVEVLDNKFAKDIGKMS